jgi:MFS family permease
VNDLNVVHTYRARILHLIGHYFLVNLGYFAIVSTLVVALKASNASAPQIAIIAGLFTFSKTFAKIPVAPLIDRISPAKSVMLGCLLASAGFGGLQLLQNIYLIGLALIFAGLGISINSLACKQLAAAASDFALNRAKVFSIINVATNVAAGIASPVALIFVGMNHYTYVVTAVSLIYLVAGTLTWMILARSIDKSISIARPNFVAYAKIAVIPGMPSVLAINLFGWFMYGQLYSVLALYVSNALHRPGELGFLYTVNAGMVVLFQIPTIALIERLTGGDTQKSTSYAFGVFTLSFALAYVIGGYIGALAFVIFFTVAEMIFMPSMDVLLLDLIGSANRAMGYGVLSISTAIGESTGNAFGVMLYRNMDALGQPRLVWVVLSLIGGAYFLTTKVLRRNEPASA